MMSQRSKHSILQKHPSMELFSQKKPMVGSSSREATKTPLPIYKKVEPKKPVSFQQSGRSYKEHMRSRRAEKEEQKQALNRAKELKEREEVRELRKKLVFRARRLPRSKPSKLLDYITNFTVPDAAPSFYSENSTSISFIELTD